jgi:beta-glucuronidase
MGVAMKHWRLQSLLFLTVVSGSLYAETGELIQNSDARSSISLNGEWHVIVDPYETGFYYHRYEEKPDGYFRNVKASQPSDLIEYDFAKSPTLNVPGDWNTQDDKLFWYEGTVWYQRDFSVQKASGKHYILYFDAVNYTAVVYVNGEKVGRHEGGFTAFQFDVTAVLKNGGNFVVVKVDNRRERDNVPTVNTDWWNYGGITRPVKLLELDASYVADYLVQLHPQKDDTISGWIQLGGDDEHQYECVRLQIAELGIDRILKPNDAGYVAFQIEAIPELWSPENPKRYEVQLSYGDAVLSDRIGFRRIAVEGEDILMNGEPIYLRGISIHEESPSREGRAWSVEDARTTLTWAKELGCNFVRLAHYPHNETIIRMADEMGVLVWSEIPVYWTIAFEEDYVYDKAEQQLTEMIGRDKNRAAIIFWSVANETPKNDARYKFLDRLVTRTRELDSTRLVTAALDTQSTFANGKRIDDPFAERIDVIGINSYCGWYSDAPEDCSGMVWESDYRKPVIVSEFGGGALQGKHGDLNERWTEEYQANVYKHNIEMIRNMRFVRGTTPWILKDFRSPRRPLPGIQDYWNRKGLVSEQGVRKQAWYLLHDFYLEKSAEPKAARDPDAD